MQMTVCPLFSGSSGNSIYVACAGTRILVDAGMSAARITAELGGIGVGMETIDAILITHEHIDHVRGLGVLSRKYGTKIYANEGTWNGILAKENGIPPACRRVFETGEDFYIGSVNVQPFAIPHDAMDPVGYVLTAGMLRCAVATDIGHLSPSWMDVVSGAQVLVLEANHDVEMVERGEYPMRLKKRVLGRNGHLCNADCAKALVHLAQAGAKAVFLSHLSADNNLPELAYNTVCAALDEAGYAPGEAIRVHVARRDRVSDMVILGDGEDTWASERRIAEGG